MEAKLDFPYLIKSEDVKPEGTFKGYASIFDKEKDGYGDIVAPGAFSKTISEGGRNKNGIPLLWQHRNDSPIGVWTMLCEDKKGLYTEGLFALDTQMGHDAYALCKMGAIKGLSIGFDSQNSMFEVDNTTETRTLKQVELWEISLVTFPAKITAQVMGCKSIQDAKTERELEEALRDSGVSKSAALYIVKLCRPSLRDSGAEAMVKRIYDSLKKLNKELRRN